MFESIINSVMKSFTDEHEETWMPEDDIRLCNRDGEYVLQRIHTVFSKDRSSARKEWRDIPTHFETK